MSLQTIKIHADGMDWPLFTFLDAYGYTSINALDTAAAQALMGSDGRLSAVTSSGEVIAGRYARDLPWPDVIAAKPANGRDLDICENCGALGETIFTGAAHLCDDCFWEEQE